MKAARLVGPRQFEILDVDTPKPNPGEVLVRIEYASICGSDLLNYNRVLPEEDYPLRTGLPCHETSGVVEESMDESLKKGDRVVALTYTGGLMEYVTIAANRCIKVPEHVDPQLAVLCQPIGTVIYAVQKLGSVLGKKVVILGQGPIGLSFTEFMARGGASQVIVTDIVDPRLEVSKVLGATDTINASKEDVLERVKELTGGALADVVIDACGDARDEQPDLPLPEGAGHGGDLWHAPRRPGVPLRLGHDVHEAADDPGLQQRPFRRCRGRSADGGRPDRAGPDQPPPDDLAQRRLRECRHRVRDVQQPHGRVCKADYQD